MLARGDGRSRLMTRITTREMLATGSRRLGYLTATAARVGDAEIADGFALRLPPTQFVLSTTTVEVERDDELGYRRCISDTDEVI